jgi:hypothetical protein
MVARRGSVQSEKSVFYPFSSNGFSRSVCFALVPAIISYVIARAPQYHLNKIGGWELPFSFDAIMLILVSPLYFVSVGWLLKRVAERAGPPSEKWEPSDVKVMSGLTTLLGASALFLLVQFFVVLAPAGKCGLKLGFTILWTYVPGPLQVQHCMSTAKEINEKSWYYMQPLMLQAWINIALVALSLWLLWGAWRIWRNKLDACSSISP